MHDYMIYGKTRFYFRSPGTDTALDREEVLDALKELHIGEWEKYYDPMRVRLLCDGWYSMECYF